MDNVDVRRMIGLRITKLRESKGWTRYRLAERSGLKASTISRVEEGLFSVKIDTLKQITDALGADIVIVENDKYNDICLIV